MKKYILIASMLLPFTAMASITVDPTITPTYTLTCVDPIEREDGTPLAIGEIAIREFFVSTDKSNWTQAGSNTSTCRQVYDLSAVPDGQYYYSATVTDTDGRQSQQSAIFDPVTGYASVIVKRLANPKAATGFSGVAS